MSLAHEARINELEAAVRKMAEAVEMASKGAIMGIEALQSACVDLEKRMDALERKKGR